MNKWMNSLFVVMLGIRHVWNKGREVQMRGSAWVLMIRFSLLSIDNHAERMQIYHEMSVNYEEQKRMLHDYYNQIGCVQGLLKKRQYKEVEAYAEKLSDLFPGYMQSVDVNHPILNVVLNQK